MGLRGFQGRLRRMVRDAVFDQCKRQQRNQRRRGRRQRRGRNSSSRQHTMSTKTLVDREMRKIYRRFDPSSAEQLARHILGSVNRMRSKSRSNTSASASSRISDHRHTVILDGGFVRHLFPTSTFLGGELTQYFKYLQTLFDALSSSNRVHEIILIMDGAAGCSPRKQPEYIQRRRESLRKLRISLSRHRLSSATPDQTPMLSAPLLVLFARSLCSKQKSKLELVVSPGEADDMMVARAFALVRYRHSFVSMVTSDSDLVAHRPLVKHPRVDVLLFNSYEKTVISSRNAHVRACLVSKETKNFVSRCAIAASDLSRAIPPRVRSAAVKYLQSPACGHGNGMRFVENLRRKQKEQEGGGGFCDEVFEFFLARTTTPTTTTATNPSRADSSKVDDEEEEEVEERKTFIIDVLCDAVEWYDRIPRVDELTRELASMMMMDEDEEQEGEEDQDKSTVNIVSRYLEGALPPAFVSLLRNKCVFWRPVGIVADRLGDFWRPFRRNLYARCFSSSSTTTTTNSQGDEDAGMVTIREFVHNSSSFGPVSHSIARDEIVSLGELSREEHWAALWPGEFWSGEMSGDDVWRGLVLRMLDIFRALEMGDLDLGELIAFCESCLVRRREEQQQQHEQQQQQDQQQQQEEISVSYEENKTIFQFMDIACDGLRMLYITDLFFSSGARSDAIFQALRSFSGWAWYRTFQEFKRRE